MIYDALEEAEGTGTILTVVYSGGSAPGHKRKIIVRRIDGDVIHVIEHPDRVPRTYLAQKIKLVDDNDPAPWMLRRTAAKSVVPAAHFSGWLYDIRPPLWAALGVAVREVVDQERTKPARERAIAAGMEKSEATRRFKFMKTEHAIQSPPIYDFHEGDIFYHRHDARWLQVMGITSTEFEPAVEVHGPSPRKRRRAYRVSPADLAASLHSGIDLPDHTRIRREQSLSMATRFLILDPLPGKMGPAVQVPTVQNILNDYRRRATYLIMAYRQMTRAEMSLAAREHLSGTKPPKPGETRVIITTTGYDM